MIKMKKIILSILILTLLICIFNVSVIASSNVKVILDGKELSFDVPPQIVSGRTMVPLRAIFEAMGAKINWDASSLTVTAIRDNTEVILKIGSIKPTVNGIPVFLDQPGIIVDGRTLAPLRFVAEAFGGSVEWNDKTQTATIYMNTQMPSNNVNVNPDKWLFRSSNSNRCIISGSDINKGVTIDKNFNIKNPFISLINVKVKRGSPNGTDIIFIPNNVQFGVNLTSHLIKNIAVDAFDVYDELKSNYYIQIDVIDLNNDNFDELVISIGNLSYELEIFALLYIDDDNYKNTFLIMDSIEGQQFIEIDKNGIITVPYGSSGLFDEYIYGEYWNAYAFIPYNNKNNDTSITKPTPTQAPFKNDPIVKDIKYEINNNQVKIIKYYGSVKNIVIPDTIDNKPVTVIGDSAFSWNPYLLSVTLPSSIKLIEKSAFQGIEGLTNVILSDGLVEIGESAFSYCKMLPSIVIPKSVIKIGSKAFDECNRLKSVYFEGNAPEIERNTFTGYYRIDFYEYKTIMYRRPGTTGWTYLWEEFNMQEY